MNKSKINFEAVDKLPPIKKEQLAAIERSLCESKSLSRKSEELLKALSEIRGRGYSGDKSYLQKLIKDLNDIYGVEKGNKDSGANYISRGPEHHLRNVDNLAFPEQMLNAKDRERLNKILRIVSLFDGAIPLNNLFKRAKVPDIDSLIKDATCHAEMDIDYRTAALIEKIYEGITEQRVLKLTYPQMSEDAAIRVSPYYIKRFNNKWFLLGKVRNNPYTWSVIALSRIVNNIILETEPTIIYQKLKDSNLIRRYYQNVIGFEVPYDSAEEAPIEMNPDNLNVLHIIIHCANEKIFRLIKENPIHTTQIADAEQWQISIDVIENNLLYKKLLSYGPSIEVISPKEIRHGLMKRLEEAHRIYQNG